MEQYRHGKASINQYVDYLSQNGASFRIHYWGVMPRHYNTTSHQHSFLEVCYVLEGEGTYIDDGQMYFLQKDTLFISKPNILHEIKSEESLYLFYIGFELIESKSNKEWISLIEEMKNHSEVVINFKKDNAIRFLWQALLIQATKTNTISFELTLKNLAFSLITILIEAFCPTTESEKPINLTETSSELLATVKIYIEDNISQRLQLEDTASQFHLSGRHLSRLFQSEERMSYSSFVQNERIQKAAALLKSTDLSIKDIAERTGFTNVQYFTRVFTSKLGSSPGNFRTLFTDVKKTTYTKK